MTADRRDILGLGLGAAAARITMPSSGVHAAENDEADDEPERPLVPREHLILTDSSTGHVLVGPLMEDRPTGDVIFDATSLCTIPILEDEDIHIPRSREKDGLITTEEIDLSDIGAMTVVPRIRIAAQRFCRRDRQFIGGVGKLLLFSSYTQCTCSGGPRRYRPDEYKHNHWDNF
jgi:hypothetical protein